MKFDEILTQKEKTVIAEKRGYDTGEPSKGTSPPKKPKIKARPTGGLKPDGAEASITWMF